MSVPRISRGLAAMLAATLAIGALGGAAGAVVLTNATTTAGQGVASPGAASASAAAPSAPPVHYGGTFGLTPKNGQAGTSVRASGQGFAPNVELALVWNTVRGHWVLGGEKHETFLGRSFDPVAQQLGTATTDASGTFAATFNAPHDFGFSHDVTVERTGTVVNKASFSLDPTVTVTPTSGPPGTPIEVTMDGVGWAYLYNNWLVAYDNGFVGWLSSVTTGGLGRATIPATGEPGVHLIGVFGGNPNFPYLNTPQSPTPDRPTFSVPFTVTGGSAVLPPTPGGLDPTPGVDPGGSGTAIWTDPASAPVGTSLTLHGRGFAPGAAVDLDWSTVVGNRVSGSGWVEQASRLGVATAGSDGRFALPVAVPDDLGGAHRIGASVGGTSQAETSFTLTASAVAISPAAVAVGDEIVIHLKGVGWTETANIYTLVYDNAYLGYACGFNSKGDVVIRLKASGAPGWHFIYLYPAIYKGKDIQLVEDFKIPQLTGAADHPGEKLPIFRFAVQIQGPTG